MTGPASYQSTFTTSSLPFSAPIPSVLPSAASALAASNTAPASQATSIPGYGGPNIPQLRSNPQVNDLANQVFSVLLREIPALASLPSSLASAPNLGSSFMAPTFQRFAPQPPAPPMPSPATSLHHLLPPSFGGLPGHVPPQNQPSLTPAQLQLQQFQRQLDELHALHGFGHPQQFPGDARSQAQEQVPRSHSSLDSLYSTTIKNPQYRASDFSKLGNFTYSSQIKQSNMNLALFTFGSLKHLLAISDGTLPSTGKDELNARLQHLCNVLEIICLTSN